MTGLELSRLQRRGLARLGDVMIPGDGDLPRFSATPWARHVGRLLGYLEARDRRALGFLLAVFGVLPRFGIRAILGIVSRHPRLPDGIAAPFRLLDLGLRGLVMTLYYADLDGEAGVHKALGWDSSVVERPLDPEKPASEEAPSLPPRAPAPAARVEAPPSPAGAFERARRAAPVVARLGATERARRLGALRRVILRRREEIIDRIQRDTAKSRSDALVSEIFGVLDNLAWLEKRAPRILSDRKIETPIALLGKRSWLWPEPLGTVLIIAPWNYPFYQAVVPLACAFAAGNAVVFKPSEWTPLEGLVEDLLDEAGFGRTWVQVVYGDGAVGAALVDERPDKIFFTGSTRTGRRLLEQASHHLIPVELELGGKDAMIVFDDVAVERAAAGAAWGALTNTGQSCTSVERLYVQEGIYEPFRAALVRIVDRITQGVDRDGDADLGAMTTPFQVEIVARHVADAREKGARFLTGNSWDGASRLIPAMVVENLREDMRLLTDETFGPVIPLLPFRTEDEVIRRANDTPFGLTASVWSRDLDRARRVARALHVGGVSINNVMATEANPALPFGGVRASGFGRYKGELGLLAFCNPKSVLVDRDGPKIEAQWYPYTRTKYRLFTDLVTGLFGEGLRARARFAWSGLRLEREAKRAHEKGRR